MRALTMFLAALLLLPIGSALEAAAAEGFPCHFPLGAEAEQRVHRILDRGTDIEYDLIDALRMPGAQRSPAWVLSAWGQLALVAEVKVDQGTNITWGVFLRILSLEDGWNTTPRWFSSEDPSNAYPVGVHIRPQPVFWNDSIFVAWDAQGSQLGGPDDRFILLRSVDRNLTFSQVLSASDTDPARANQHPSLLPMGNELGLAYSTAENETDPSEAHLVYSTFDGSSFTPSVNVSPARDGWSDVTPTLAWDGAARVFAAWVALNTTTAEGRLLFAVREAGVWSSPQEVAELGASPSGSPAIAYYAGQVFLAWSTHSPALGSGADWEVQWRVHVPETRTWSQPSFVNPQPSSGDDLSPTLTVIEGNLLIGWSTTEDFYYSHGSDPDPVYRVWNGSALGPLIELTSSDDRAADGSPGFADLDGFLYAHWMWQPPSQPGQPRGDAREAVRLVSRPLQWYDGLSARYSFPQVSDNGSSRMELKVSRSNGSLATGPLTVRLSDGSLHPLESSNGTYSAWLPLDPDQAPFEVLACGKPVPVSPEAPAPPPSAPPFLPFEPWLAVAALAIPFALITARARRRALR